MIIPFHIRETENILALPTSQGMHYINPSFIIRVQAMSNYCKLFFTDGSSLVVAKLLAWFEEKLGVGFWRIHRSHLVNRNNLIQIQICSSQSKVVLNTGEILPIAKRKKHEVMELMAG